jgi:hypothetical protein
MDVAELSPVEILPRHEDLAPLVVRLLAEVDQLRAEVDRLLRVQYTVCNHTAMP